MKLTVKEIDDLISRCRSAGAHLDAVLSAAKKFDNFPLTPEDNDALVHAYNIIRGIRKDLQLIQLKPGGIPER
jgi:hypothetical protein